MLTYNQEKYIRAAIESALMQRTTFNYEIVIGDDCSTDSTRIIVSEYAARNSDKIRLLLHPVNLGILRNLAEVLSHCRGELVAFLEGDDYWTSSEKLQKQVDFLDEHPECALCFHNATVIWENRSHVPISYNSKAQQQISSIEDLWRTNFIASCTVMWRKQLLGRLPEWFFELPYGDWALHMLCAQHGKIGYIGELLGVYRVHSAGAWSKLDIFQQLEAWIAFYESMNANLDFRYSRLAEAALAARRQELALARSMAENVQRTLPAGAVILVMTDRPIRQFQGYETRYFPTRSGHEVQRPFASGRAASAEVAWIVPRAIYNFRLYKSAARDNLLASVQVSQEPTSGRMPLPDPEVDQGGAFITASPNPVPAGPSPGKTTITWSTGDDSPGIVDVLVNIERLRFPTDGADAIAQLETLRAEGGQFLLVPCEAFGLLNRYAQVKEYLDQHYRALAADSATCLIYDLRQPIR
jgi:glycosyltransferase involved in cell wall biosynthesis